MLMMTGEVRGNLGEGHAIHAAQGCLGQLRPSQKGSQVSADGKSDGEKRLVGRVDKACAALFVFVATVLARLTVVARVVVVVVVLVSCCPQRVSASPAAFQEKDPCLVPAGIPQGLGFMGFLPTS